MNDTGKKIEHNQAVARKARIRRLVRRAGEASAAIGLGVLFVLTAMPEGGGHFTVYASGVIGCLLAIVWMLVRSEWCEY